MNFIDTAEATAVIADYFDLICDTEYAFDETEILRRMNAHATNDVVSVIRCKDCIHNVSNRITDPLCINDYSGDDIVCDYFETDGMEPDDYCSYAERNSE